MVFRISIDLPMLNQNFYSYHTGMRTNFFRISFGCTVHEVFSRNCPYTYFDHRNSLPLFLVREAASRLPEIKPYVWTFSTESWGSALTLFYLAAFVWRYLHTLYEVVALQLWFFCGYSFRRLFLICFL